MALYTHAKERQLYFGRTPLSGAKKSRGKVKILMNHHDISVTARYIQPSTEGQLRESDAVARMLRDQEKAKFQVVK